MIICHILIFIPFILGEPQRDLFDKSILSENLDFGTPQHDNKVETELELSENVEITKLMSLDYFTDSTLPCDNISSPGNYMIYCSGKLLQAVMAVKLYDDSKTFLDQPMKMNTTGESIMEHFNNEFPSDSFENITKEQVRNFVDQYFDKEGHELDVCNLTDWVPNPRSFSSINDKTYQAFAQRLHFIWIQLCRQVKPIVKLEPHRFSLLYVPNTFILPGGRFREFYYWDAYWIIKGLLTSQLYTTSRNMIKNFAYIIEKYGFIPNGGRVYYLKRSQPPLFSVMVYDYYLATNDIQFVADMIPMIEKEYEFWINERSVNITFEDDINENIIMYQYRTEADTPRPESFREDVISAKSFKNQTRRRQFFRDIGSAAESGWDFSSRWFSDKNNLTTIETTNIVEVDLNAFICYTMNILSFFYDQLGNPLKHNEWSTKHRQFRESFTKVFYVPSRKGWYDYNLRTRRHNTDFYPSIAAPLFTQCYDPLNFRLALDVYSQIDSMGALKFDGGVPTSLQNNTKQQWDFPNGWSPLNHMIIEGLRKSLSPVLQQKAYVIAEKWLRANLIVFNASNAMWEKYDVAEPNLKFATGGEYEVQAGFGWTNGAALDLILTYGDRLKYTGERLENLIGASDVPPVITVTTSSFLTNSKNLSNNDVLNVSSTFSNHFLLLFCFVFLGNFIL